MDTLLETRVEMTTPRSEIKEQVTSAGMLMLGADETPSCGTVVSTLGSWSGIQVLWEASGEMGADSVATTDRGNTQIARAMLTQNARINIFIKSRPFYVILSDELSKDKTHPYKVGGESMKITIEGEPKEIAALVVAVQGQQGLEFDDAVFSEAINRLQELQGRGRLTFVP